VEIFWAKILEFPNSEREAELLSSTESVNAARVVQGMTRIGQSESEAGGESPQRFDSWKNSR
jgi:hypothetical protein